jgi:hypothetical protein
LVSLVSSYHPDAREERTNSQNATNNNDTGDSSESHSTNSQTHQHSGPGLTPKQVGRIGKLMREGMSEKLAHEEVLGKGWVEP